MGNPHRRRTRRHAAGERDQFLRELFGPAGGRSGDSKPNHKDAMLCRQVERALRLALGEVGDDLVAQLEIDSAAPAPSASHLLVRVIVPPTVDAPVSEIVARLGRAAPRLRYAIAPSISRKRVPELSFVPVASHRSAEGGEP